MRTWLNRHRPLGFIRWRSKSIDGGPVMPPGVPRRGSDIPVYSFTIRIFDVVLPPAAFRGGACGGPLLYRMIESFQL